MPASSTQRLSRTEFLAHPAVKTGISVSVATGLYGISFGALAIAAGLDIWQTVALSALMFTGGSQFAFIGVIAGSSAPAQLGGAATGAASLLGVRNAIYGLQMKALVQPRPLLRPVAAHVTIDESAATAASQPDQRGNILGFWTAGLGVYLLWNLFTVAGALAGSALGDPAAWGLDGAATAAMLGLLWPRLRSGNTWALAVTAALITTIALPMLPAGVPILISAAIAGAWGWLIAEPPPRAEILQDRQDSQDCPNGRNSKNDGDDKGAER